MMAKHFPNDVYARTTKVEFSKPPPPPSEPPSECPRCGSINTKFCYYNNYNKSQPRHFCKSCKRHWTKGGTLRNIPVGRRRRNKRHLPYAAVSAQPEQKHSFQNPVSLPNDQKDMSNILYQALIQSSSPSSSMFQSTILESNGASHTAGLDVSAPQNSSHAEFTFSNFTSLISNVTSDNNQSSNDYNVDNSGENPDSAEESSVAPPWPADLWSWNDEIDILGSSCDLNNLGFLEGFYQWNN